MLILYDKTLFLGLEKAIANFKLGSSSTLVERLEEWGRTYCLINAIIDANGTMRMRDASGRLQVHVAVNTKIREIAIAELNDDFEKKRSAIGKAP